MGRNRQLSKSLRTDKKVNAWPIELRFFWTQLWGYCDDYGRGVFDSLLIRADVFPRDPAVTLDQVDDWMGELETSGVIIRYQINGHDDTFFFCPNWEKHQRLSRPTASDIPAPHAIAEQMHVNAEQMHAEEKGKRREEEGEGITPPTPFCKKHPTGTDSPCRACGNARRLFEIATVEAKNKPTAQPPRRQPTPAECKHKYVSGWCVAGCEQAKPEK